jgi:glycine oxidase
VEPAALLDALHGAAHAAGVRVYWERMVTALDTSGDRVRGVQCADGKVAAGATVIASGAWSARLVPGIDVRPVRGQILELDAPAGALNRIIVSGHRYLLPRADGRIVVGSTVEEAGFDAAPTAAGAKELRAFASGLLPASAAWPVLRHWAGLRPGSADGIPIIGSVPGRPGLWLNTGHFRNGITLAPGSAARLAGLMAD